jgi:ribonuclease HI
MSLEICTEGSCTGGRGVWSYTIKYRDTKSRHEEIHSDNGEETGTTDIQMRLMAILKALAYAKSMDPVEPIIVKSDCSLCIKCITREYDCASDDAFRRGKVTRGFVQYLQEIWWKMSGMDVRFEIVSPSGT